MECRNYKIYKLTSLGRESYGMFVNTLCHPVAYEIYGGGELLDQPYLPQQWNGAPNYCIILTSTR
jgi:hypothetical protein